MATANSSRTAAAKPDKPREDFPLFAHRNGQWAKKVRGKLYYFGKWDEPDAALDEWVRQKDDLLAGRKPRVVVDGITVREVCNRYLHFKKHKVETGELKQRTWDEYEEACKRIIRVFGASRVVEDLQTDDFEQLRRDMAKTNGLSRMCGLITKSRMPFKYAYDEGLIDRPVRFGQSFQRPTKKTMRIHRAKQGPKMFEADQLKRIVDNAPRQMKAMTLLAINAGLGNGDVAELTIPILNLKTGWVNYPRPKTGVDRRFKLWPETIEAINVVLAGRSEPKRPDDYDKLFLTKRRCAWDPSDISTEFRRLLERLKLYRPRVTFYAVRHTFETIAGESRDQVAVDAIMGHSRDDMASAYRERISDERLADVCEFVRNWLFAKKEGQK